MPNAAMVNLQGVPIRKFPAEAFSDLADGICAAYDGGDKPLVTVQAQFHNGRMVTTHARVQRPADGASAWMYLRGLVASDYWEIFERAVPSRIGVDNVGWFGIREVIYGYLPGSTQGLMDEIIIEVTGDPTEPLPPRMELSEYDLGHEVVIVSGEAMGKRGRVTASAGGYVIEGGHSVRTEFLRAVRAGEMDRDVDLAPLRVRVPAGSPVWVPFHHPWAAGVLGEYRADSAAVWLMEVGTSIAVPRDRTKIRPRDGAEPPTYPKSWKPRSAPGANSMPRMPAFTQSSWGMSPSKIILDEASEFAELTLSPSIMKKLELHAPLNVPEPEVLFQADGKEAFHLDPAGVDGEQVWRDMRAMQMLMPRKPRA